MPSEQHGEKVQRTLIAIERRGAAVHIKVLADLVIWFPAVSIDIQVLADLQFILQILQILQILIQTRRRSNTEKRSGRP